MAIAPAGTTPPAAPTQATAPTAPAGGTADPTAAAVDANAQAQIDAAIGGMVQNMLMTSHGGVMQALGSIQAKCPVERW